MTDLVHGNTHTTIRNSGNDMGMSFWSCQSVLTQDLYKQQTSAKVVLNFLMTKSWMSMCIKTFKKNVRETHNSLYDFVFSQGGNDNILWYCHNSRILTGCTWQVQKHRTFVNDSDNGITAISNHKKNYLQGSSTIKANSITTEKNVQS